MYPSYIQEDVHIAFSCLEMNTVFGFSCFFAKLYNLRIVVLLSGEERVQMKIGGSRVNGCDIQRVETGDLVHLGLRGSGNVMLWQSALCIMDVINHCLQLRSIDIGGCVQVTDAGESALGATGTDTPVLKSTILSKPSS